MAQGGSGTYTSLCRAYQSSILPPFLAPQLVLCLPSFVPSFPQARSFFPFPFWSRYPLPGSASHSQPRLLPVALASPVSASLPLPCLRLKTPPTSGSGLSPQVAPTDSALPAPAGGEDSSQPEGGSGGALQARSEGQRPGRDCSVAGAAATGHLISNGTLERTPSSRAVRLICVCRGQRHTCEGLKERCFARGPQM